MSEQEIKELARTHYQNLDQGFDPYHSPSFIYGFIEGYKAACQSMQAQVDGWKTKYNDLEIHYQHQHDGIADMVTEEMGGVSGYDPKRVCKIIEGHYKDKIKQLEAELEKVKKEKKSSQKTIEIIKKFALKHEIDCGESIFQCDFIQVELPELVDELMISSGIYEE